MTLPAGYDAWLTTDPRDGRDPPDECRTCGSDTPAGAGNTDNCPVCEPDPMEGETMQWSEQNDKIAPALVAALAELTNPPKDARNPHFNSRYTTLDAAIDHVRPVLAKHGLTLLQPSSSKVGEGGKGVAVITTMILHTSGQWAKSISEYQADRAGVQAVGSCITYGRRYDLQGFTGIAGDPDLDGEASADEEAPAPAPRAQLRDASAPRSIRTADGAAAPAKRAAAPSGLRLPVLTMFGTSSGKALEDCDTVHLQKLISWQEGKNYGEEKFRDRNIQLCDAARAVIASRPSEPTRSRRAAAAVNEDPGFGDDDIPF